MKKIEMKIKIVPKTTFSLFFKNLLIFKIVFLNWELIKKYLRKKIEIKIDNQFNIILIEKIFTVGSNEENKFIIS